MKKGTVVRLNSGGPLMTVTQAPDAEGQVEVTWLSQSPGALPIAMRAHSDCFEQIARPNLRDVLSGIANADPRLHGVADLQLTARLALEEKPCES